MSFLCVGLDSRGKWLHVEPFDTQQLQRNSENSIHLEIGFELAQLIATSKNGAIAMADSFSE